MPDRRVWTVPGMDRGLVGKGRKPVLDGGLERTRVTAGEVGTPHSELEEGVAGEQMALPQQADAARRVARSV